MTPDNRQVQSYVYHEGKCFIVSTITRDSSAMLRPGRYNETLVWAYDWDKRERGEHILHMDEDCEGSIRTHQQIVERIFKEGPFWEKGDESCT